ncbi:MAG: Major Facilitator Superfamily protein [bacterium ADurb.Bin429]|nr:MAG: Major Facilitator Superfamily protein [bacterium ADurb.Bin429]
MPATSRLRPGLPVTALQRALKLFNWNVGFRSVFDYACTVTGFLFVDYALSLGIAKEKIGLFPALINLACVLQLAALWMMNHVKRPKLFTLSLAYLEILFMLGAVVVGAVAPPAARFPALFGLIFLAAAASSLARPTLDAWLASTVPARMRGRYLGIRFAIMTALSLVTTLTVGALATRIPRDHTWGFALLLIGGCLCGAAAVFALHRIPMLRMAEEETFHLRDIRELLANRPYLRLLLGLLIYDAPFLIGTVYYQVFHLKILHLNEFAISILAAGYMVVKIITTSLFGPRIDSLGARRTSYLMAPIYLMLFFCYVVSSAQFPWPVYLAWALAGIGDGAWGIAITSGLYSVVPESRTSKAYFAVYNLALLLFSALGAAVAVVIVEALKDVSVMIGPWRLEQFHLFYLSCTLYFAVSIFGAHFMPGPVKK